MNSHEKKIVTHEEDSDYVFQVECYEKAMDERTLISITKRRKELCDKRETLEKQLSDIDITVDRLKLLHQKACDGIDKSAGSMHEKLEFIMRLIDSGDILRAKLELSCLLKEE